MAKAVRYTEHGDIDVLKEVEIDRPVPTAGQVLIRVITAGVNLVDASIRSGQLQEVYPVTFPAGQGVDFAGVVEEYGDDVHGFSVGDDVLGFVLASRAAQATYVLATPEELAHKPEGLSWEVAGSLYTAGTAAWASVQAIALSNEDVVVISAAAGGVGSIAAQLAVEAGAKVIGLASERNHDWLRGLDVIPLAYGNNVKERILEVAQPTAFIDAFGNGYVELAIDLGVHPDRINTVIDFEAAAKYGTHADGNHAVGTNEVLAELAALADKGILHIPTRAYPLAQVYQAYWQLEQRHTRGKVVLKVS